MLRFRIVHHLHLQKRFCRWKGQVRDRVQVQVLELGQALVWVAVAKAEIPGSRLVILHLGPDSLAVYLDWEPTLLVHHLGRYRPLEHLVEEGSR